jgi:hypothetical protein
VSALSPETLEAQADTLELINAEVSASLARQSASSDRIDTKSVFLVGYAGAAASFLAIRHFQPVLGALAFSAYAAAAAFGVLAYSVRLHKDVPEPGQLFRSYLLKPRVQVLAALAATRIQAFEANDRGHHSQGALLVAEPFLRDNRNGADDSRPD